MSPDLTGSPISPLVQQGVTAAMAAIPQGKSGAATATVTAKGVEFSAAHHLASNWDVGAWAGASWKKGWDAGAQTRLSW